MHGTNVKIKFICCVQSNMNLSYCHLTIICQISRYLMSNWRVVMSDGLLRVLWHIITKSPHSGIVFWIFCTVSLFGFFRRFGVTYYLKFSWRLNMIQLDVGSEVSSMTNRFSSCKLCRQDNRFSAEDDTKVPKHTLKLKSYQIFT